MEHDEWKKELIIALSDAGVNTIEQIDNCKSMSRLDKNPFLPSIGKIVSWCKPDPASLGVPCADSAYSMAANYNWKFYIVYLAAHEVGVVEIRQGKKEQYFKQFEAAYLRYVSRIQNDELFEKPKEFKSISRSKFNPDLGELKPMTASEAFALMDNIKL